MEQDNKKTWLIVAVLATLVIVIVVLLTNFNKPATDQNVNETVSAYTGEYNMDDRVVFEGYLMNNISMISPEKEVLGGKFYVTTIDWLDNRSGTISYEDGHIALKADFKLSYADAAGTVPQIEYFNIIPDLTEKPFYEGDPIEIGEPVIEPVIVEGDPEPGLDMPIVEPVVE